MAIFQPRPFQAPNLTTNYSAENQAVQGLADWASNLIPNLQKQRLQAQKEQILGQIGTGNIDYEKAGRSLIALGDTSAGATLLTLGQKAKERDAETQFFKNFGLGGSTAAPPASIGTPNEVENRFIGGVQKAGVTNPIGLGAVAAYGNAESKYNPGNVNRTWNDPSESGRSGQAGGIMSWRADRLQNLQRFAASRGEQGNGSPETQALFLAQEDPTLVPRLNAAKTPQEANQIMANAWRFAGYDRPGQGEYARREGLTTEYAKRFGSQPAQASTAPQVQVAENEADVQRLERQQAAAQPVAGDDPAKLRADAQYYAQTNPEAARQLAARADAIERSRGVQVAQAPSQPGTPVSDAPAQGAAPAQGFVVPGTGEVVSQQELASNPRLQRMIQAYAAAPTDRARAFVKQQMDLEIADIKQRQDRARQQVRPLTDQAERQRYGIAADDTAPYQIDGNGRVTAIGGNRTNVNIDQRGETEEAKAIGQAAGKRAGEMMATAANGTKQLQRIGQLESLLKNIESGRLQPGRMSMAALGKSAGVNEDFLKALGLDPTKVGDAQAINAITGRMVVDMIGSGGFPANNFSDADRAFITGTVPSLANDPRGNKIIMEAAKRTAQIDIEKARSWREWRKDNKGGSFDDFEVQWNEQLASQDRFADLAKQAEAITGPQQPAQDQPKQIQSQQDYQALPSGSQYVAPDGSIRTKR